MMMKRNLHKTFLATAVALSLTACGGGGGGSSEPNPAPVAPTPPPAPSVPNLVVTSEQGASSIVENGSATLQVNITGAQDSVTADITITGDSASVTSSESIGIDGGTVTLSVGELLNDGDITVTISITDGDNRTESVTERFDLSNTSAEAAIADYTVTMEALQAFAEFTPEALLYERVVQISQMANSEIPVTDSSIDDAIDPGTLTELLVLTSETGDVVSNYNAGTVDETVFATKSQDALALATTLSSPVADALEEAISATSGIVPNIEFAGVFVSTEAGVASQFIGNTNVGSYQDGEWVFSQSYDFLSGVVFTDQLTCDVE